jgi:hypothetical protein
MVNESDRSQPSQQPDRESESPPGNPGYVMLKCLALLVTVAALTISVRREAWLCPHCTATKEMVSWRTLVAVPLSQREDQQNEKPAAEHTHDWHLQSFQERYLFGLLFKGVP